MLNKLKKDVEQDELHVRVYYLFFTCWKPPSFTATTQCYLVNEQGWPYNDSFFLLSFLFCIGASSSRGSHEKGWRGLLCCKGVNNFLSTLFHLTYFYRFEKRMLLGCTCGKVQGHRKGRRWVCCNNDIYIYLFIYFSVGGVRMLLELQFMLYYVYLRHI